MELRFGESEENLRAEVRAFLKENIPADADGALEDRGDESFEAALGFNEKLKP